MKKIQKRNFFLAIVLTFISLYILGALEDIRPDDAFGNSFIELVILHIFLISTSTFFIYRLLIILSKRNPTTDLLFIFCSLVSYVLVWFTINPLMYHTSLSVSTPYIIIGDYLRDQRGINWYFMDWGGWLVTIYLYLIPIYTYLLYQLTQLFMHRKSVHDTL